MCVSVSSGEVSPGIKSVT